jgi:hypothetical protein
MSIYLILMILFAHYIADFIFQAESWATNKWQNELALLKHVTVYTVVFCILMIFFNMFERTFDPKELLFIAGITFSCHYLTDFISSKIVHEAFVANHYGTPIPNMGAFSMIGCDQFIHYLQLFLTFWYVTNN